MAKQLSEWSNTGKLVSERLIRTEMTYVTNMADLASAKERGTEQLEFVATLDLRTSKVCRKHDGNIIDVDKAVPGTNIPPLHCFCRSTTIDAIEGLEHKVRFARDPETGKPIQVPASMKYPEWYQKYVKKNPKAVIAEKMRKNKYADKEQHNMYKNIFGKDAPKTLEGFQKLKYTDIKRWQELRKAKQDRLNQMEFKDMQELIGKLGNKETRLWYKSHDKNIPMVIDKTKAIKEQAIQACELRNAYRTQARELMKDQKERKYLDEKYPNPTFEQLVEYKKLKYGLNDEEAYYDIVRSSTTTNKKFDKKAGIKEE